MVSIPALVSSIGSFGVSDVVPQVSPLESIGAGVSSFMSDKIKRDTELFWNKNGYKFKNDQLAKFEDMKLKHEDIDTFTGEFSKQFDEASDQLISESENIDWNEVQNKLKQIKSAMVERSIEYQVDEKARVFAQGRQQAADDIIKGALIDGNFEGAKGELQSLYESMADQTTPAEQEEFRQKMSRNLAVSRIKQAIDENPGSVKDLIKQLRDDLDSESVSRLQNQANDRLRANANKAFNLLHSDPIKFAGETGEAKPIDLGDANSMMQRNADAKALSVKYGTPLTVLSNDESKQLASVIESAEPDAQLEIAKSLSFGFGDVSDAAFLQLKQKNESFSYAAGLALANPEYQPIAESILVGDRSMKKDAALSPSDTDTNPQFNTLVGNAFLNMPEVSASVRNAAKAHYVTLVGKLNQTGKFSNDTYERALREVLGGTADEGGIGEINGQKMVLPIGITEGMFENFLEKLTPQMLTGFSVGGAPPQYNNGRVATPDEIKAEGMFQSVGLNKYIIIMDQDKKPLYGSGPQGYYVIDVSPDIVNRIGSGVPAK